MTRLWSLFGRQRRSCVRIIRVVPLPASKISDPPDSTRRVMDAPFVDVVDGVVQQRLVLRVHVVHALGCKTAQDIKLQQQQLFSLPSCLQAAYDLRGASEQVLVAEQVAGALALAGQR